MSFFYLQACSSGVTRRRVNWARLIQKAYEADPLECSHYGATKRTQLRPQTGQISLPLAGTICHTDSLEYLLRRPCGSGVLCCVGVHDFRTIVAENHQHKERSKCCRWYRDELNREEMSSMVLQECAPSLRWWLWISNHVLGFGNLRYIDTEIQ